MDRPTIDETQICKWKGSRRAAYSVGGDDSLRSQLFFTIPEIDKRGIRGTWWMNLGRGGAVNFKNKDGRWAECWIACANDWKAAASRGHDFGNHNLHHLGGQPAPAAAIVLARRGHHLGNFSEEIARILAKYDCVQGRGGGIEDPTSELNPSPDTLRSYVDVAIQEEGLHLVGFHGIGPD